MLLGVLALVWGCTPGADPDTPEPPPVVEEEPPPVAAGVRVAVVLPPASEVDPAVMAAVDTQLATLVEDADDGVRQLRVYPAADRPFVADLAGWLAEQHTELVCVLGDRAESVVVPLAALYRDVRFCALPAAEPTNLDADAASTAVDGVARVELRAEELGYLVGLAARLQARDAPVGLVLGGGALPEARFREGLLAGLAGAEVLEADVGDDPDVSLTDRAQAVVAANAAVVVIDGGAGAREAIEAIGSRAAVFGPASLVDASQEPGGTLGWTVRWDRALGDPLAWVRGDDPGPTRSSVGVRDGIFELHVGARLDPSMEPVLAEATDLLASGDVDPRVGVVQPSDELVEGPAEGDPDESVDDGGGEPADESDDD